MHYKVRKAKDTEPIPRGKPWKVFTDLPYEFVGIRYFATIDEALSYVEHRMTRRRKGRIQP